MTLAIAHGVLMQACADIGLTPAALRARSRHKVVMRPRQCVAYVLRKRTAWSYPQIASFIGLSDHTTALHAANKIADLMERDDEIRATVERLMAAPEVVPFSLERGLRVSPKPIVKKMTKVPKVEHPGRRKKIRAVPVSGRKEGPLTREQMGFVRHELGAGLGQVWLNDDGEEPREVQSRKAMRWMSTQLLAAIQRARPAMVAT
jgi:hypothetical protein